MKLIAQKTERGWELADETGTFESPETSEVFTSKRLAQAAANEANAHKRTFDESQSAICGDNY